MLISESLMPSLENAPKIYKQTNCRRVRKRKFGRALVVVTIFSLKSRVRCALLCSRRGGAFCRVCGAVRVFYGVVPRILGVICVVGTIGKNFQNKIDFGTERTQHFMLISDR
jgi:hypothetical protein